LIQETIKESGLKLSDIYSVEMVGCGTRIPAIMDASMKAF
jgi:molecular chaperone DnaK (HSP70)